MVKDHPTKTFPSLCTAKFEILPSNQSQMSKEESLVPSLLRLTILLADIHLYVVNGPTAKTFHPLCTVTKFTVLLNEYHPILYVRSLVPSVLIRIRFFSVTQLYVVKAPPIKIFPSFCSAKVKTAQSNQLPMLKDESL